MPPDLPPVILNEGWDWIWFEKVRVGGRVSLTDGCEIECGWEGKKEWAMGGGRSNYKDWERADVRASTAAKDQPTPACDSHLAFDGKWRSLIDQSQSRRVDGEMI